MSYLKNHCLSQRHEHLHLFPRVLALALSCRSLTHIELTFFIWCEVGVQLHCFAWDYSLIPAPFVEKTDFSPLKCLGAHVENQLPINVGIGNLILD